MISQKNKGRWCGYCGQHIYGVYEVFDNHLEVCESILAHQLEQKRKNDKQNPTSEGNPEMGKI